MRAGALASGVVLLLIGALLFLYGYNAVSEYQTFGGQIARGIDALFGGAFGVERHYRQAIFLEFIGAIIGIIGLGLLIYGAVAESSRPELYRY